MPGLGAAVGALLLLLSVTSWAALRPGRVSLAAVPAAVLLWWVFDKPVEGPILLSLTPAHGLTLADLAPLPCLLAVLLLSRRRPCRT